MWAACALASPRPFPPSPHHMPPSFSHTLHRDLHRPVVSDAPQGLDVARHGHGPAAVAVFLAGKGGSEKVSGPHPPLLPPPRLDWARWGQIPAA